jgi:outer membrane immunogenic protein
MKHIAIVLLAASSLAGFSGIVSAADMPAKAPVLKAPAGFSAIDWSGFYFGVHGGYGRDDFRGTYDDGENTGDMRFGVGGGLAGLQAGYNWQFGRIVYGVEIDGSWANLKGSRLDGDDDRQEFKTSALASARGRAGIAIDNALVYTTLGLGYARSKFTVTGGDVPSPADAQLNAFGYVSGLGLEWAFAPGWSLRGEYLYYGFNKRREQTALTSDSDDTDYIKLDGIHVARAAINYRFGGGGPVVAPAANWAGLYAGLHLGYGRSRITGDYDDAGNNGSFDIDPRGAVGGGQIGYNWQSGAWVYGVELDGTWSDMKRSRIDTEAASQELKTDILASARGRLGVAADNKLIYVTGGIGYARSELTVVDVPDGPPDVGVAKLSSWGPVIGAGTEWSFGPNWSARLEGLTYLFNRRIGLADFLPDSDANDSLRQGTVNVVRLGVNYRFAPPAVVAKY